MRLRKLNHTAVNEPGLQIQCDSCNCELTHSIRMKCADPICEPGDGVDICPSCFCAGKEFAKHKRTHAYRVVVRPATPLCHWLSAHCPCRSCTRIQYLMRTGARMSEYRSCLATARNADSFTLGSFSSSKAFLCKASAIGKPSPNMLGHVRGKR